MVEAAMHYGEFLSSRPTKHCCKSMQYQKKLQEIISQKCCHPLSAFSLQQSCQGFLLFTFLRNTYSRSIRLLCVAEIRTATSAILLLPNAVSTSCCMIKILPKIMESNSRKEKAFFCYTLYLLVIVTTCKLQVQTPS